MSRIGKNYLASFSIFLLSAIFNIMIDGFIENQAVSLVITVAIIAFMSFAEAMGMINIFRGFVRFCFPLMASAALFPLADVMEIPFSDVLLYVGFVGLLISLVVLLWRIFKYDPDNLQINSVQNN